MRQQWDHVIDMLLAFDSGVDPSGRLEAVAARLRGVADAEQAAFRGLLDLAASRVGEPA